MSETSLADVIYNVISVPKCGPVSLDFNPRLYLHLYNAHLDCPDNTEVAARMHEHEELWCYTGIRELREAVRADRNRGHAMPEIPEGTWLDYLISIAYSEYFDIVRGPQTNRSGQVWRTPYGRSYRHSKCRWHTRDEFLQSRARSRAFLADIREAKLREQQRKESGIVRRRVSLGQIGPDRKKK